jgi:ribosomal protein L15
VGRGINMGRTCGRGNSGQNSRSGGRRRTPGFAGGQTPLHLAIPKIHHPPPMKDKRDFVLINLGRIQELIQKRMIDLVKCKHVITLKELYDAGIRDAPDGVKICARVCVMLRVSLCSKGIDSGSE